MRLVNLVAFQKLRIMKQFFKFIFASMIGFIIGAIVLTFFFGMLVSILVNSISQEDKANVVYNSVLHIKFNGPVNDRENNNPFDAIDLSTFKSSIQPGLNDILRAINYAATDEKIAGIFLEVPDIQAGTATVEEIRDALEDFKGSGKFVVAYADFYSQKAYYLVSVADEIWMHPEGFVWMAGLSAQSAFLRGALDKLGIEPQVIRKGKYKSAAETWALYQMSPENKLQVKQYVDAVWQNILNDISRTRNVSVDTLVTLSNKHVMKRATELKRAKLITNVGFRDEFDDHLYEKLNLTANDKPKYIPIRKYSAIAKWPGAETLSLDKIAILYASGTILDGGNGDDVLNAPEFAETVYKAGEDERVKAIVLRVNSPGGSPIGSETILRAVQIAGEKKPVVVSMGDVAASGGYYISCAADTVLVNKSSITGSIGVIGLIFNAQKFLNDKLGINFDGYKTNPYADFPNMSRPLTDDEKDWMGEMVDTTYHSFISRVSTARKMSLDMVDSLGGGRVYVGTQAMSNKLVDSEGGLLRSIDVAAKLAGLSNYRVVELPTQKDPFIRLMEGLGTEVNSKIESIRYGDLYPAYTQIKRIIEMEGIQILLPPGIPLP